MKTPAGFKAALVLAYAVCLVAAGASVARGQGGGSLSGVVVPDLPPEVSPGETVSFEPPPAAAGGSWTLCGVVAEPEAPPESPATETPRPPPAEVTLDPGAGAVPFTAEEQVGLAVALAILEGSWAECGAATAATSGSAPQPLRIAVVNAAGFAIDEKGLKRETGAAVPGFAIDQEEVQAAAAEARGLAGDASSVGY